MYVQDELLPIRVFHRKGEDKKEEFYTECCTATVNLIELSKYADVYKVPSIDTNTSSSFLCICNFCNNKGEKT